MNKRQVALLRRLQEIRQSDGLTTEHLEEMLPQPGLEAELGGPHPAVTPGAIESWERFSAGAHLAEDDFVRLKSIILLNGARPSFDIQRDSYPTLPSLWQELNDQRPALAPLIRGIGRVQLTGHPRHTFAGTAFVVGDNLLLTNRHAAQLFVQGVGPKSQLQFIPGITTAVDLKQEVGLADTLEIAVTAPALVLDQWDIAVLEVEGLPAGVTGLPLAPTAPASLLDRMAAVIGYPSFDPSENLIEQIQTFRSVFDKKRLQPGRLKGMARTMSFGVEVEALAHDCTTLGGNSGSALIDVSSATVVGIHFGGQPLVNNYAVPTWVLASHPQVRAIGVRF